MKSLIFLISIFFILSSVVLAQRSVLSFSLHGSSSRILDLKTPPGDNPYVGLSGKEWAPAFSFRKGASVSFHRSFSPTSKFAWGLGLRYTQKGFNAKIYTWIPISIEDSYYSYHWYESGIDYLQIPISIEKRWTIKKPVIALQLGIAPEINVFGYDSYDNHLPWPANFQYPEKHQKKYALSSFGKVDIRWPLKNGNWIHIGAYAEYQMNEYWKSDLSKEQEEVLLTDPTAPWDYFTHLIGTHLFNSGIEVGYTFGFKR